MEDSSPLLTKYHKVSLRIPWFRVLCLAKAIQAYEVAPWGTFPYGIFVVLNRLLLIKDERIDVEFHI